MGSALETNIWELLIPWKCIKLTSKLVAKKAKYFSISKSCKFRVSQSYNCIGLSGWVGIWTPVMGVGSAGWAGWTLLVKIGAPCLHMSDTHLLLCTTDLHMCSQLIEEIHNLHLNVVKMTFGAIKYLESAFLHSTREQQCWGCCDMQSQGSLDSQNWHPYFIQVKFLTIWIWSHGGCRWLLWWMHWQHNFIAG